MYYIVVKLGDEIVFHGQWNVIGNATGFAESNGFENWKVVTADQKWAMEQEQDAVTFEAVVDARSLKRQSASMGATSDNPAMTVQPRKK